MVATNTIYVVCSGAVPDRLPISSTPIILGRHDECDIVLRQGRVSRHHCQVQRKGAVIEVTDLGSSNGTLLDGVRLVPQTPTPWKPGAALEIADYKLQLEL
jgi:pSer/pThr/pTyr-binding forkhead associated (FHA) protein